MPPLPEPEARVRADGSPIAVRRGPSQNRHASDQPLIADQIHFRQRSAARFVLTRRLVAAGRVDERRDVVSLGRPEEFQLRRRVVVAETIARLGVGREIRHVDARRQLFAAERQLDRGARTVVNQRRVDEQRRRARGRIVAERRARRLAAFRSDDARHAERARDRRDVAVHQPRPEDVRARADGRPCALFLHVEAHVCVRRVSGDGSTSPPLRLCAASMPRP